MTCTLLYTLPGPIQIINTQISAKYRQPKLTVTSGDCDCVELVEVEANNGAGLLGNGRYLSPGGGRF